MPERKRPPIVIFLVPLVIGVIALGNVMESPQFESYRTLHVIQLVAAGACFGASITGMVATLARRRWGS
jgi:hypothetical protein